MGSLGNFDSKNLNLSVNFVRHRSKVAIGLSPWKKVIISIVFWQLK